MLHDTLPDQTLWRPVRFASVCCIFGHELTASKEAAMPVPPDGRGKDPTDALANALKDARTYLVHESSSGNYDNDWNYFSITLEDPAEDKSASDPAKKFFCKLTFPKNNGKTSEGTRSHPQKSNASPNPANKKRIAADAHAGSLLNCDEFVTDDNTGTGNARGEGKTRAEAIADAVGKGMDVAKNMSCPPGCADLHIHLWTHEHTAPGGDHYAQWWVKVWCGNEADESS